MTVYEEVGPIANMPAGKIVEAARLVKEGRWFSLATSRFPGMPLFPGHPPFQVLNYRTPPGIRAEGAQPWGPPNEVGLGYMAEYVMATSHSGAHVDALAHMTIGEDDHWYGGGNTGEHLTDKGPSVGDAEKLPPFFTRGVLLDAAGYRGVAALPAGSPVGADELEAIAAWEGVEVRPWDTVLIRTGYLAFWPDSEKMAEHKTAGPDASTAEWLLERGVVATGTDTETYEVQPAPDRGTPANPQPVHTRLLIEAGIYLMESVYLEELAQEGVHEFLFVALPVKIRGATGSMIDPLAVI
ncbi:MAG: cyclase family protein [Gammaproteobacteria bacterium]|nr:cyclase family protein [Gammaproteobacteria bacterium]